MPNSHGRFSTWDKKQFLVNLWFVIVLLSCGVGRMHPDTEHFFKVRHTPWETSGMARLVAYWMSSWSLGIGVYNATGTVFLIEKQGKLRRVQNWSKKKKANVQSFQTGNSILCVTFVNLRCFDYKPCTALVGRWGALTAAVSWYQFKFFLFSKNCGISWSHQNVLHPVWIIGLVSD